MASAKILQRAETAMEIDEDFLSSDEDDEGVIDEDSENCRENAYAEGEESENEAVEETKSNAAEQEPESISEQQDDERKANASYLDSTEDDQTEVEEYIQLKRKIGELSEVEGQLVACRSSYDSLKAELQELQNNRESLRQEMFKQSEEHRAEVNRLKDELKKMANGLPMMGLVKKSV
ncbi:semaphorin-5B-like protein [Anopheles sinensis]|uniref:Semaphorin-5B-like protein n=1 Tax=Anopheles sinensis TaxID=74873 RepID=A0A084WCZ4_ANOSI|nr:semaphorin-5B-like protein [Anopheles sinensis]